MGSDHLPILIDIMRGHSCFTSDFFTPNGEVISRPSISLKNFDKKLFPTLVNNEFDKLSSISDSLDPFQEWYNIIMNCSLKAGAILYDGRGNRKEYKEGKFITGPLKKSNNSKQRGKFNSPWWDSECDILVKKRKWAFKKLARCPSRDNLLNYRNISSLVRKELNKKKRNSFRDFVSGLNLASASLRFWDTIKKF